MAYIRQGKLLKLAGLDRDSENGVPMGFAAYDLEERLQQDQAESLEEYAELKDLLLKRTQRAGAFLAGYLFLTVSGPVSTSTCLWPFKISGIKVFRCTHSGHKILMDHILTEGPSAGILMMCCGLQAALSTLVGTAGSYAYLRWLIHDMDGLSEDMVVPFRDARAQPAGPVQTAALGFVAYRSAALLTSFQHFKTGIF